MTIGEVKEKVILKLSFFKITNTENVKLDYLIDDALNSINNITNQNYTALTFPKSILGIWIDKAVGAYINLLKITDSLPDDYDISSVATQIKEGDTTVSFGSSATSSDETRLTNAINYLLLGRDSELIRYRRLAL